MEDLKKLSKKEIAARMLSYIHKSEELKQLISAYIKDHNEEKSADIHQTYKELKECIYVECKYLEKVTNDDMDDISVVHNCYRHGILDAGAKGFTVKINAEITQAMYNAVDEALYYLSYYMGKAELEKFAL